MSFIKTQILITSLIICCFATNTALAKKPSKEVKVQGLITTAINGQPLSNAQVTLYSGCTNDKRVTYSDQEGRYELKASLQNNCCYRLVVLSANYPKKINVFCTKNTPVEEDVFVNIVVYEEARRDSVMLFFEAPPEPEPIVVNPPVKNTPPNKTIPTTFSIDIFEHIYSDFDKATIRKGAIPMLNELVKLLQQNTQIRIEINAHADARGSDEYNQDLSEKRANNVIDFLTGRGIAKSRIRGRGYGEMLISNECVDGVPCSEYSHQINRRTEFRVTGKTNTGTLIDKNSVQPAYIEVSPCTDCPF